MKIINYDPKFAKNIITLWRASKRHALGNYSEPHNFDDMHHYLTQVMSQVENVYLGMVGDKLIGFVSLKDN